MRMRPSPIQLSRARRGAVSAWVYMLIVSVAILMGVLALQGNSSSRDMGAIGLQQAVLNQANNIRARLMECQQVYGSWPSTSGAVRTLTCPGAPTGFTSLWGADGRTMPLQPPGFTDWQFTVSGGTTSFTLSGTSSASAVAAFQSLLRQNLSSTEAKCVNTGGTITFTVYVLYSSAPTNTFYPLCGTS